MLNNDFHNPALLAQEFNALVQAVIVTDDGQAAAEKLVGEVAGLSLADALGTPFPALGTEDEIATHLLRCRARWGITWSANSTSSPRSSNGSAGPTIVHELRPNNRW